MTRELRTLINKVRRLASEIRVDLGARDPKTAPQVVALFMFAKAYKSYQAAILLFREGFWQDAATISRTLLELGFRARWFSKDPELASELFVTGLRRDRLKLLRTLTVSGDNEVRAEADALLKELRTAENIDTTWRNWWADESNIEKLAGSINYQRVYNLQYRHLSWFVHSSPIAEKYYVREASPGTLSVLIDCKPDPPSREHREFAETLLSSGAAGMMDVLAMVDTVFELGGQAQFDRLEATFRTYAAAANPET